MNDNYQLPQHGYPAQPPQDDEIDLKELFMAIWQGKWIIILLTIIFAAGGVLYALSQPNTYQANATLASTSGGQGGGLSAMASQFGGLASLAGINVGSSGTSDKAMALATLQSRKFINAFIDKYDLLVPLMATQEWNASNGQLIIDPEVYNQQAQQWLTNEAGESLKPSDWNAYKAFSGLLSVSESKENGLVTLSITHFSPFIAQQWVDQLVIELNAWMKQDSLSETRRNIQYLEQQIEQTNIADMQSVFYQLIEEQTKNLMLAQVEEEFAFKVIDPAVVPEEKAGPKRALICVIATLLGGMLGIFIVLIRYAFSNKKED